MRAAVEAWYSAWSGIKIGIDKERKPWYNGPIKQGRRNAPEEAKMKVKVTIKYTSDKFGHSRYGYTRREETAVKFVEEDELDEVVAQFEARHEVTEVILTKLTE